MASVGPSSTLNGTVYGIALTDDTLYAGGTFTTVAGNPGNRVAQWDGSSWSPVGSGVDNWAFGVAFDDTQQLLYSGGSFTGNVSVWDGANWSVPGGGVNGAVYRLIVDDTMLIAAGNFTTAGGNPASKVATWDGTAWSAVGSPAFNGNATALALDRDSGTLYAGGSFTTASGSPVNYVAFWDGFAWAPLGSGVGNFVEALAVGGGKVYAGGRFTTAGGSPANYVAEWDGTSWQPLGDGVGSWVRDLQVDESRGLVYAVGDFTTAGGATANRVAVWDSGIAAWIPFTRGANNGVCCNTAQTLVLDDSQVYLAGQFSLAAGVAAYPIAKWTWNAPADLTLSDDSAAAGATITVSGIGLIGVNDVRIGSTPAVFTRDDSTQITVTVPTGSFIDDTVYVNAVGGIGEVGTFTSQARLAYDWNGATGGAVPTDDTVYLSGSSAIVQGNTGALVKSGSTFEGWNSSPDGSGASFAPGDPLTLLTDDTLYAQWAAIPVPSDPPAPVSSGPPLGVSAVSGDASARVSWSAPVSSGSFPVSAYQAIASPGGRACLVAAPSLACEVTGLTNGTAYTFTVRALTGAGWSPSSEPSGAVTPVAPVQPSIVITGSRDGKRIQISGMSTGLQMGAELRPWTRLPGQSAYSEGSATILVSMDGTFEWGRKTGKRVSVYVQTPDASVRSNVVTIQAR